MAIYGAGSFITISVKYDKFLRVWFPGLPCFQLHRSVSAVVELEGNLGSAHFVSFDRCSESHKTQRALLCSETHFWYETVL